MNSNVLIDNAFFQLSPRRTRCELFISADGKIEKLASGFLKPFVTHLKVAEEQSSHSAHVINLEVVRRKNAATWFNKGTVERFVRFVSTPEVLELLGTLDAEMSQLEGARKMYSLGAGHQFSGENETKSAAATDATKKELVRAIDVRISAVKQDLSTACARASAAGFNLESVSDLLFFADHFGAFRLSEACKDLHSLSRRRPELISHEHSLPSPDIHSQWKNFKDSNVSSSSGSDMSIDEPLVMQNDPARLQTTGHSDARVLNQQQQQDVDEPATSAIEKLKPDSQHFVEYNIEKVEGDSAPNVIPSSKPVSRRLSVQDRINLFESKKKEQSSSPIVVGGNSSATTASRLSGAKGELHRRNPSDLCAEKLVLRRWSGASDMSIDPNSNSSSSNDWKENGTTEGTPTSSATLQYQSNSRNSTNECSGLKGASNDPGSGSQSSIARNSSTFSSSQEQVRSFPQGEIQARHAVYKEGIASTSIEPPGLIKENVHANAWKQMGGSFFKSGEGIVSTSIEPPRLTKENVQANTWKHMGGSFSNSGESAISKESGISRINSQTASEDLVNNQLVSEVPSRASLALKVPSEQNKKASLPTQIGTSTSKMEGAEARYKNASDSQVHFRASSEKMEEIPAHDDSVHPEASNCDFYDEQEEKEQTILAVPKLQSKDFSAKARQSSLSQRLRFPVKASRTEQKKKFQGRGDDVLSTEGSSAPPSESREIKEDMEAPPLSLEVPQTSRPNTDTDFSNVLHLKAEELEDYFSEQKLKNHGYQIASASRNKDLVNHETRSVVHGLVQSPKLKSEKVLLRQDSTNVLEFDLDLSGLVESSDVSDIKQTIGNHASSDFLRGKLYSTYMTKRDAKLNQECESQRAQKEAKMKEMIDSLDRSQVELKASFTGFSDRQKITYSHFLAEKMKSFKLHSTLNSKEQTSEYFKGDQEDVDLEQPEPSTDNQSKKTLYNKTLPSTSLTSVSIKHLMKSASSGSFRHGGQTENPVMQSIPAFLNSKNENIKPTVVVTKATARGVPRNFTRNKSFIDDAEILKEDRHRRSNSMRKGSATNDLKDMSSLNSEKTFHKVQIGELKQYLKKGNGVRHGFGTVSGKSRILETPEELKNNEKFEEIVSQKEDSPDVSIDDNLGRAYGDGNNLDHYIDSDDEKSNHSQESCGPESENAKPLPQREDSTIIFSKFSSAGNGEGSPEESFGSMNSHIYHSRDYRREALDIYGSLDSPTKSPWNSHSLSHIMDSEAIRMRKKWGSAQIPVIAASVSQQPRRDVTKGFKRLLKFGRKSRGSDYLVNDWVSASTASDGDDDPEDGRNLVHRPSDDLRKSLMGYNVTSYDGFNNIGIFPEQAHSLHNSIRNPPNFGLREEHISGSSLKVPRSFFSLSSFRSKGGRGDSKPR